MHPHCAPTLTVPSLSSVPRLTLLRPCGKVEEGLLQARDMDPTDGRAYVSLGKLYLTQKRFKDAGKIYADGSAATEGQNPYIWQAWATLEVRLSLGSVLFCPPPSSGSKIPKHLLCTRIFTACRLDWEM